MKNQTDFKTEKTLLIETLKVGALILAVLIGLCAFAARSATVSGTVRNSFSQAVANAPVVFYPLSNPQSDSGLFLTSLPVSTVTDTNGQFSVTVEQGDYRVIINGRDKTQISVPNNEDSHTLESLITGNLTYVYPTVPTAASVALATSSTAGSVVTDITEGSPTVYTKTTTDELLDDKPEVLTLLSDVDWSAASTNMVGAWVDASGTPKLKPFKSVINALYMGAKGDGSTDDTAKIQAAIDTAAANTNAVYLPAGVYQVTTAGTVAYSSTNENYCLSLPSNTHIYGDGPTTVIRLTSGADANVLINGGFGGAGASNITIRDLKIEGNDTGQTSAFALAEGIQMDVVDGLVLDNVWVEYPAGYAFRLESVTNFRIGHIRADTRTSANRDGVKLIDCSTGTVDSVFVNSYDDAFSITAWDENPHDIAVGRIVANSAVSSSAKLNLADINETQGIHRRFYNISFDSIIGNSAIAGLTLTYGRFDNIRANIISDGEQNGLRMWLSTANMYETFNANTGVDTSTDTITITGHAFSDGDELRYDQNSGTLLGGLTHLTKYWVVNSTANTIQLAATEGGSAIDITSKPGSSETQRLRVYGWCRNSNFTVVSRNATQEGILIKDVGYSEEAQDVKIDATITDPGGNYHSIRVGMGERWDVRANIRHDTTGTLVAATSNSAIAWLANNSRLTGSVDRGDYNIQIVGDGNIVTGMRLSNSVNAGAVALNIISGADNNLVYGNIVDNSIADAGSGNIIYGNVGSVNTATFNKGQLHVAQTSTTSALTTLKLGQSDDSEGFFDLLGNGGASATGPISSWKSGNTIQGFYRVEVNGTSYWTPFYDAPTGP